METSDPLPGSPCTQISPPGIPRSSKLPTQVARTAEGRCGVVEADLEGPTFKYYIRNTRNIYMI